MLERLGGIWFGLAVLVVWTLVCAVLLSLARDAVSVVAAAGLWLVVVLPTVWGIRPARLR